MQLNFLNLETVHMTLNNLKRLKNLILDSVSPEWFKDLKYIKVTGGEPFLHPQFLRWIVALADSGIAPKLRLKYLQTVLGGLKKQTMML